MMVINCEYVVGGRGMGLCCGAWCNVLTFVYVCARLKVQIQIYSLSPRPLVTFRWFTSLGYKEQSRPPCFGRVRRPPFED